MDRRVTAVFAALMGAVLAASIARAGVIYRWVDDQGKTHFSDVVPDKYRSAAKPVGVSPEAASTGPTRTEGPARTAASAVAGRPAPAASAASAARPPSPAASPPAGKRPATTPTADTDCATWQRLYRESLECFGPFRTVRGATKAEAFEVCNPVPEPPIRCLRATP